jgi:hypothetical protein
VFALSIDQVLRRPRNDCPSSSVNAALRDERLIHCGACNTRVRCRMVMRIRCRAWPSGQRRAWPCPDHCRRTAGRLRAHRRATTSQSCRSCDGPRIRGSSVSSSDQSPIYAARATIRLEKPQPFRDRLGRSWDRSQAPAPGVASAYANKYGPLGFSSAVTAVTRSSQRQGETATDACPRAGVTSLTPCFDPQRVASSPWSAHESGILAVWQITKTTGICRKRPSNGFKTTRYGNSSPTTSRRTVSPNR